MKNQSKISEEIKRKAEEMGFFGIGFARAEMMDEEARNLEQWLNSNYHGEMSYMENHFDKRIDPTKLVPGAKTVISLMYNYYNPTLQKDPNAPKISMYAYGKDYHKVFKKKIIALLKWIQDEYGEISGRCFVDSAPVLERDWAKRSGLGWIGKHTLLLSKKKGSYFFLGEIICDLSLIPDTPVSDHCGTCTKCIDACPTDAISEEAQLIDGSKCISYLTIEKKGDLPTEFKNLMENYMFGCDICQDVCPWNRFSTMHDEEKFLPKEKLLGMSRKDWEEITMETFDELFLGTPVKRTKYEGLVRNINFLKK